MKFQGTEIELRSLLAGAGVEGAWEKGVDVLRFRTAKGGGVLSWWPNTGTYSVQGKDEGKRLLETALAIERPDASVDRPQPVVDDKPPGRRIFVVHGHDRDACDQLELALHRLRLEPFILMNTSGNGRTIIEALEGSIGREYTSDFGIVLFTPDDVGYAKEDGETKAEPRVRQNVVLETGMLLASLTRERMAILVKGHVEMPSDLQGIIQLRYNDRIAEVIPKLCARLREAGIELSQEAITAAC